MRDLIASWRDQGRTVMVATHDLGRAARDYDLVLALNRRADRLRAPPPRPAPRRCSRATFAGHVARVGNLIIETEHRHEGAG